MTHDSTPATTAPRDSSVVVARDTAAPAKPGFQPQAAVTKLPAAAPVDAMVEGETEGRTASQQVTASEDSLAQQAVYHRRMLQATGRPPQRDPLLGVDAGWLVTAASEQRALQEAHEAAVRRQARLLGLPLRRHEQGRTGLLVGFEGAKPVYQWTTLVDAAITTGVSYVRQQASFGGVDGSGFAAMVFDAGLIRHHDEFSLPDGSSRVFHMEHGGSDGHADHIGGIIAAEGKNPSIKGMAPAAVLLSWDGASEADYLNYGQRRPGERTVRAIVSNASIGGDSDDNGGYSSPDAQTDERLWLIGYLLPFASAGNGGGPWDSMSRSQKEAKNLMAVASVNDVSRDADGRITGGGRRSGFSAWGPSDDGRIKPDIAANGEGVLSTSGDGSGTASKQGTSQASPNACGSAIIVQDYCGERLPGHLLRAASLKGLLCHTADDIDQRGPDYRSGWGILNALRACRLIKAYGDHPGTGRLVEGRLDAGDQIVHRFSWDGSSPIRATLSWSDPPSEDLHDDADDDRTPDLVNDLDLRLIDPNGDEHLPWVMPYVVDGFIDGDQGRAAITGDNTTDNVEQVLLEAPPAAGSYELVISHKGSLRDDEAQLYALFIDGVDEDQTAPPPTITTADRSSGSSDQTRVIITGADFLFGARAMLRPTGGGEDVAAVSGTEVADRLVAWFDLADVPAGDYRLLIANPDGQESATDLPFTVLDRTALLTENFDSGIPGEWSHSASLGTDTWQATTDEAITGTRSAFVANTEASTLSQLISPSIDIPADAAAVHCSFDHRYRLGLALKDVAVLELSRDGGDWYDVIDVRSDASFVEEWYDHRYTSGELPRDDWQGDANRDGELDYWRYGWMQYSFGVRHSIIRLDPAVWAGHEVRFRWRFANNLVNAADGWWIDNVLVTASGTGAGNAPPSITAGPAIDPDPVTGTQATLSIAAEDSDGPAALSYAWSVSERPLGAPQPTIDPANGNDATEPVISFGAAGDYRITVTVSDGLHSTTAELTVTVTQSPTEIGVIP